MPYDWAGTRILQENTSLPDKRRVFDDSNTLVPTDLREWVTPGDREEIRRALRQMPLPQERDPGTFDRRALIVWRWVIDNIDYAVDASKQRLLDYWQFPAETIALGTGDCEDCAFLMASLLLGSGISGYCVRVVLGTVAEDGQTPVPHAWPVYKDEAGRWCLLEATLPRGTPCEELPSAESSASSHTGPPVYDPVLCLNNKHIWQIGRRHDVGNVDKFVDGYSEEKLKRPKLNLGSTGKA